MSTPVSLNKEEESWTSHSPNITLPHKSILYGQIKYKRFHLYYEKAEEDRTFQQCIPCEHKYVKHKKQIEIL